MARTANISKLLEDTTKVRDRTARYLYNAQNEALAASAAIDRAQARLVKATKLVDELTPAHEQNNAAVVALGGEAADYTPPVDELADGSETGDAPVETNPDAAELVPDSLQEEEVGTSEPVADETAKPRRVRRGTV